AVRHIKATDARTGQTGQSHRTTLSEGDVPWNALVERLRSPAFAEDHRVTPTLTFPGTLTEAATSKTRLLG
ncbi:MAG: hypothetical protein AAGK78_09855, partial [Planctomycetota bacterium]